MKTVKEGVLKGSFTGYRGSGTLFEFSDGECWRQMCNTIHLGRAFMPDARILIQEDKYYIQIDGIELAIEVEPHSLTSIE